MQRSKVTTLLSKVFLSIWLAVWNSGKAGRDQPGSRHIIACKHHIVAQELGGEIVSVSLNNTAALRRVLSLVTTPSASPVRRSSNSRSQEKVPDHLAYLNRQHTNAVSIAGGYKNKYFITRDVACILPHTTNSLKDSGSCQHSAFYRLRLHSCTSVFSSPRQIQLNINAVGCSHLGFNPITGMAGKQRLGCWVAAEVPTASVR